MGRPARTAPTAGPIRPARTAPPGRRTRWQRGLRSNSGRRRLARQGRRRRRRRQGRSQDHQPRQASDMEHGRGPTAPRHGVHRAAIRVGRALGRRRAAASGVLSDALLPGTAYPPPPFKRRSTRPSNGDRSQTVSYSGSTYSLIRT
jgi:hypothetical protein